MWWSYWIEVGGWATGLVCALIVLRNPKTQTDGIGTYTTRALTISLGIPLLLTLAMERLLTGETTAALVGALLGIGIQKDKEP